MQRLPSSAEMHRAIEVRDRSFDGLFFVGIRSTGIFCRPSCPSRPTRPANRTFHPTAEAAEAAGFRACKRCRPLECDGRPPEWAHRLLAALAANGHPRWTDADLRRIGVDPTRARRWFRRQYGMTFQSYSRRQRMGQALQELRRGDALDRVAIGHGFESHSGFRSAFGKAFGHPPGRGRSAEPLVAQRIPTPLGPMIACAGERGVCRLEFDDPPRQFAEIENGRAVPGSNRHLELLAKELGEYFAGRLTVFTVPVVLEGTAFQRAVWTTLQTVGYGVTRSYADIARQVRSPNAVRAVGQANGRNPVCIIVPCHRIVNSGGKLGGYGGGLWRKQYMLDLEQGEVTAPTSTRK